MRGSVRVDAWAGAASGGSFRAVALVVISGILLLLCGGRVICGNVPNSAYVQGGQVLGASVGGCRARLCPVWGRCLPLPFPPPPCVRLSTILAGVFLAFARFRVLFPVGKSMYKKVCTILLYLNRSEIIPPSKNLLRGADFSACTRY